MIFDPSIKPTNGQVAVAVIGEDGPVIRRWYRGSNTIMLVADSHTKHDDIVLTSNTPIDILGTVVWVQTPHELN